MIVKNLRESREILNIKQKDIAKLFNLHFTTISGWETGKDTIPLEKLIEYANHYNYSLDYLFGCTKTNDSSYLPIEINLDIIANNLRMIRKKYKLTQEKIGNILNTNQATYAHYENALYLIPTKYLFSLTKIYKNLSIDQLLGRKKK